jgi:hypothetical protein
MPGARHGGLVCTGHKTKRTRVFPAKWLDSYHYIDNNKAMNRIAVITGATRNLGFSLAKGLAQRLDPADTVYLTGRDPARVAESVHRLSNARALPVPARSSVSLSSWPSATAASTSSFPIITRGCSPKTIHAA